MPIKHNFTVLCEYAMTDSHDRVSLINVIRNVQLDEIPGAFGPLFIVASLTGAEGEQLSIRLVAPGRKELFRSPDQPVPKATYREDSRYAQTATVTTLLAKPVVFEREGVHHVVVRVGGRTIHREPFGVFLRR